MKKFASFIVNHKIVVAIIIAILTVLSAVAFFFVEMNSDLISYLPQHMPTKQGLDYLEKNFGMKGDATVGVTGFTKDEMKGLVEEIEKVPGVREKGVMWYGTAEEMMTNPVISLVAPDIAKSKVIKDMLNPILEDGREAFVAMLFLDVPSSSDKATKALNQINNIIQEAGKGHNNFEVTFGGSAALTRDIFNSVFGEIWKFMLIGILVVFMILVLTTTSIIEPFILLLTLGVSIILNLGTNIIFPSVSTVTFSISAILQLGLSMDYAIFLTHAFYAERKKCLSDEEAMKRAIPKTFSTVFASALTTVFGFVALFFMQFTMGADIGRVLAKGVFLSMFTVLTLQPCLLLIFKVPLNNYQHRILVPSFKRTASFSVKHRISLVALAIILIIPAVIMQSKVSYTYMEMGISAKNPTDLQKQVQTIGNSIVVILPVENGRENLENHRSFLKDIRKIEGVDNILGLHAIIPEGNIILDGIIERNITAPAFKQMVNDNHTMYSIMMNHNISSESADSARILKSIKVAMNKYFPVDPNKPQTTTYITGTAQSVDDLANITNKDFAVVTIVSILIVFAVLIFTLKSIKLSAILIAVIELGIFINLAICYLMKVDINFMAYIIISAVQLGATVDYAILYTVHYQRRREYESSKQASFKAMKETGMSIVTSATIIAGACYSVTMIAKNTIIKQLTELIGRGAIISAILVIVILPAFLSLFTHSKLPKRLRLELRKTGHRVGFTKFRYNLVQRMRYNRIQRHIKVMKIENDPDIV